LLAERFGFLGRFRHHCVRAVGQKLPRAGQALLEADDRQLVGWGLRRPGAHTSSLLRRARCSALSAL